MTDRMVAPTGLGILLLCISSIATADEWLQWRGPHGNGTTTNQSPPVRWDQSTNLLWKSPVPGRGHSSPIIVKEKIYLTTADEKRQTQSLLCYDQASGEPLWSRKVHEGKLVKRIHKKNTHASPTIASDGKSLFVYFNNDESVLLTKFDLQGNQIWQKKPGGFRPYYAFGFAASPTIHKSSVIVSAESEKIGFICAYDKETGRELWRTDRPSTSYSSPIVATVEGQEQLLLSGGKSVSGFDPMSGKRLWSTPTIWQVSCGTLVWSDRLVFASGGYPRPQTLCVKADGSGELVWQNKVKCYEQSLLYHDGFLYGISDAGIGFCWRATDGEEMWKARMEGPVSSSPILVDGKIYYSSERGSTFVFRASPKKFDLVAENKLGDSAFATPAFCDNRIYARIGFEEDGRLQEYLVCIGEK